MENPFCDTSLFLFLLGVGRHSFKHRIPFLPVTACFFSRILPISPSGICPVLSIFFLASLQGVQINLFRVFPFLHCAYKPSFHFFPFLRWMYRIIFPSSFPCPSGVCDSLLRNRKSPSWQAGREVRKFGGETSALSHENLRTFHCKVPMFFKRCPAPPPTDVEMDGRMWRETYATTLRNGGEEPR